MNEKLKEIVLKYKPLKYTLKGKTINVNSMQGNFVIKPAKKDIISLFSYLNSRSFYNYPKVIAKDDDYITYEYLKELETPKEQQLLDLILVVAKLHNKTVYFKEVTEDKYKEIYDNIKDNVIAPTSEGYFDINIDHSNVDVSFTEKINLNFSGTNTVSDLKITGYAINDGSIIEFNGNEISTDCLLSDNVKINKYRFYVTWIDDDGQTMQNKDDTEAAKNGNASISVSLSFIQKAK